MLHLEIVLNTIYIISIHLKNWKSVIIDSNQCKHSKSMDWIDWKLSKSETIHSLTKRKIAEVMYGNHSTYWIVNHWNPFKLVNIVSVILLATLNWRIYHNYNPFKLVLIHFIVVHLWFEVLNWYCIFEWLDLPNLQSISLNSNAFNKSLLTIIQSIEWIRLKWFQ